ncbi:MAG: pyridoxal-phosphate dependent enzyme [Kangiellaceae bacterium]|nr:pyridoxal-phosphate dependent enzyme [Kangiellaceae bacterium]
MIEFFKKIENANIVLKDVVNPTPILQSATLNRQLKANIFFKCESFQKVGAFKFRGAYNAISQLSEEQKRNGVIAYSSGNHAQAVALVGKMLGVSTTIVMPNNAPKLKLQATKGYGAKVVVFDPQETTREAIAEQVNSNQLLTLIKPFDNEYVIAGQGTAAYEFAHSVANLNMMVAPCGGGGLLSGTAVATKSIQPNCKVFGVEPEMADDATKSFYSGVLHSNPNPPTIADGTRTASMGDITFPMVREFVDEMKTVSEESIKEAVRFFFYRMKLVVEPSGALGLAALMTGAIKAEGNVGIIVSGGNIDGATMSEILLD